MAAPYGNSSWDDPAGEVEFPPASPPPVATLDVSALGGSGPRGPLETAYKGPGRDTLMPLQVSGLMAWWSVRPGNIWAERSGARTTPVTVAGNAVGEIGDLSGNGYHLKAPSDAARGVWKPATRTVLLDGTNDGYTHTVSVGLSGAYTMIFRGYATASSSGRTVCCAGRTLLCASQGGDGKWGTEQTAALATAHGSSTDSVVTVLCRSNADIDIYVNSGVKTNFTTGSVHSNMSKSLGYRAAPEGSKEVDDFFFAGHVRDCAIYSRALNLWEIRLVEDYFRGKKGN